MFNLWCLVKSPFVDGVDFASGIDHCTTKKILLKQNLSFTFFLTKKIFIQEAKALI